MKRASKILGLVLVGVLTALLLTATSPKSVMAGARSPGGSIILMNSLK